MLLAAFIGLSLVIICSFLFVVFRGAPYIPTHRAWVERALDLAPSSGMLVDLGCGDGIILLSAAKRGRRSLGIELNPFLAVICRFRLRRYKQLASVHFGDFWRYQLPPDTSSVFVFLAGPFMHKLERFLSSQSQRLGHDITLISYGFELPAKASIHRDGPLIIYRFTPLKPLQSH